jgi:Tfp pilus assembly protein PilV
MLVARRDRRREHGVAMTEALIAICLLVVLFASVSFFHAMYSAKAASLQQARMQAWAGTRFDCRGTEAHGAASSVVQVPVPVRSSTGNVTQRTIASRSELVCNQKPDQRDDVFGVLAWAAGTAAQGISTDSVAAVASEITHGVTQAVKDAAKELVSKINPFD